MRLRFIYIILTAFLITGCMFAVTNKAQAPGTSTGSSLAYVPVSEPPRSGQGSSLFPLSETVIKQAAVVGAIFLMLIMILKGKQFSK